MSLRATSILGTPIVQGTGTTATVGSFFIAGTSGNSGYVRTAVATTGAAIGFTATQETMILDPAGPAASVTVTMAISPQNGQWARVLSSQTFSAATIAGAAGQTLLGGPATLGANGGLGWIFVSGNTSWYRIY